MKKRFLIRRNIGDVDRRLRALLGIVLIILPINYVDINWVAILGLLFLLTSFFGRCPFYDLFYFIRKILS